MFVNCELRPRHDATPEQMKRLGTAFQEWVQREKGQGVLYSFDEKGLDSLLGGEPPNPLATQAKAHHEGVPLDRIRQDLGPLASDRSLRFTVYDEPRCTRDKVIQSLRQSIQADLVEDILIDNESWTE